MIKQQRQEGRPVYVLYTRDGARKLGEHRTRAAAERQERAVQAAKAARGAGKSR